MVGLEGNRTPDMVRTTRVRAVNPAYGGVITRIVDLPPKEDGSNWVAGDEIGLHGTKWAERNGASVFAIITELFPDV